MFFKHIILVFKKQPCFKKKKMFKKKNFKKKNGLMVFRKTRGKKIMFSVFEKAKRVFIGKL